MISSHEVYYTWMMALTIHGMAYRLQKTTPLTSFLFPL